VAVTVAGLHEIPRHESGRCDGQVAEERPVKTNRGTWDENRVWAWLSRNVRVEEIGTDAAATLYTKVMQKVIATFAE
jgi:hypothetical protein